MATESATTSLHNPTTTTSHDELVETKVNEEVKPVDQGTVSLPEGGKVENPKIEELPSETEPFSKLEAKAENKQTEPSAVEAKMSDSAGVDSLVEDKTEMEQEIPCSQAHKDAEPAVDVVNNQPVGEPATECVPEPAVDAVNSQPDAASVTEHAEAQEQPKIVDVQEQPMVVDVQELSAEAVDKPKELSAIIPTKESEADVKVPEDSKVVHNEVDKQESLVPVVDVKLEAQSEVTEQGGKPQSVEETGKQQEPPEVPAIKESEAVVKDIEASKAESKEIDEPVPEVMPKEQSEVAKQDEKVAPIEATEKQQQSSDAFPVKESEAVLAKDIEYSAVSEDVDKPKSVVPEVELEMRSEEQYAVTKDVEKQEILEAEADLKAKVEYEVPEKNDNKSTEEGTEPVVPDAETKTEGEIGVEGETATDEGTLADKVEDTTSLKEERPSKEEELSAASEKQDAQADVQEGKGEASLPDVREITNVENGKKETDGTVAVEETLKEEAEEMENGGEDGVEKTSKTKDKNVEREVLNEEQVQPIKVDDIKEIVSNSEVTERSFKVEKTGEGVESVGENKKEDNIKEETPALVETSKDGSIEEKLDEATTAVMEPVKESQDSGLEVKDEESAKISEDKAGKENAEEIAKSDAQNLEPSPKNGNDAKASQDLPREVPAKLTQKQSNNILTKMKQTLLKAKRAIIGKSPGSKTLSSDTKGDIKVK
ncbi:ABC transporter F family member 4 [Manihot esculenta]|uniref:Uncharacterized protein n=1 Tax=Manihot esculenta TaxID=3983 RepID=A0A2C9VD41_MANES|nr:ABC transporter F family member 4 [Manihot esculenta]OAY42465.1 hypothetical protein MANES_09G181900v8 [Manihot esculenta]